MYNILVVSALNLELKTVKQEIKKLDLKNFKTSFLLSWVWNYTTILKLTKTLTKIPNFDLVLNIWVCWYKDTKTKAIQVWRIKNLSNSKELIVPHIINFLELKSIASSSRVVYDKAEIWDENFVDMESYAIELVCDNFEIARIILKIPVDKIWIETKNFDLEKAKTYLSKNIDYKELFEKIELYLKENKQEKLELKIKDKINSHYKFSFSEKIILEKTLNKHEVLKLWNTQEFFEENKKLNKKEFLKKLKWLYM